MTNDFLMDMWTVYDHPIDIPDSYVARKHVVAVGGDYATAEIIKSESLEALRILLANRGLVSLARSPEDDPKIIETWI